MTVQPSHLDIGSGDERTLMLVGVVDSHTAPKLQDQLDSLGIDDDISLDVTGVEFIDSSGLRVIVAAHTALDAVGNALVLVGSSDPVDRLLEITGLAEHLRRE